MINKKIIYHIFLAVTLMTIVVITYRININKKRPEIKTMIELREITDEDDIKMLKLKHFDIKKVKELYLKVVVLNAKKHTKEIIIPDLISIDKKETRSIEQESSYVNNKNEDAEAMKRILFDSDGLNIEQIALIYENDNIYVNVNMPGGKTIEERFNIGKLLITNND